jgi:hypothetical protein
VFVVVMFEVMFDVFVGGLRRGEFAGGGSSDWTCRPGTWFPPAGRTMRPVS